MDLVCVEQLCSCNLHHFLIYFRKRDTSEMQDLVQMMTQTLHMDSRDLLLETDEPRCHSTPVPEFRLNGKYRDTLMLHGKAKDGRGDFQISDVPLGNNSLDIFLFCFELCRNTQIDLF